MFCWSACLVQGACPPLRSFRSGGIFVEPSSHRTPKTAQALRFVESIGDHRCGCALCCEGVAADPPALSFVNMALGLGLQLAFNGYVLQVCKTLRSCNESQQVQQILQDLLELVTLEFRKTDHSREPAAATSGALAQALHRVQRDLLHDPAPRRSVITALSQHLEVITTTLLPGEFDTPCTFACEQNQPTRLITSTSAVHCSAELQLQHQQSQNYRSCTEAVPASTSSGHAASFDSVSLSCSLPQLTASTLQVYGLQAFNTTVGLHTHLLHVHPMCCMNKATHHCL